MQGGVLGDPTNNEKDTKVQQARTRRDVGFLTTTTQRLTAAFGTLHDLLSYILCLLHLRFSLLFFYSTSALSCYTTLRLSPRPFRFSFQYTIYTYRAPTMKQPQSLKRKAVSASLLLTIGVCSVVLESSSAFMPLSTRTTTAQQHQQQQPAHLLQASRSNNNNNNNNQDTPIWERVLGTSIAGFAAAGFLTATLAFSGPAFAENELAAKYGGGLDTSLVDQTCLLDKCSVQAKSCLADDPSCRKGLTCTAKCLGDNSCITGCFARYGNENLDNLLKCTIEDNDCIKIAILEGGADKLGEEPRPPAPTVQNFDLKTLEGSWYKVVGYNPNYDCYACQRNTFNAPEGGSMLSPNDRIQMDVEFSMPFALPDGSPPPPTNKREVVEARTDDGSMFGSKSIALNDYSTHETMVFDNTPNPLQRLVLNKGASTEESYARTAHSEGEMFGLSKFTQCMLVGAMLVCAM